MAIPFPKPWEVDLFIFHKDCPDGFCSAFLFNLYRKSTLSEKEILEKPVTIIGFSHGEQPPDTKKKNVLICDFNFGLEQTKKIIKTANSFGSLDHHKTAFDELNGIPNCRFDMEKCGAILAYEYFWGCAPKPKFLDYVMDRDLWLWKVEGSREFSAYTFNYLKHDFDMWQDFLCKKDSTTLLTDKELEDKFLEKGKAAVELTNIEAERAAKASFRAIIHDYKIRVINSSVHISETGEQILKLYSDCDIALVWRPLPSSGMISVSVRSRHGTDYARQLAQSFDHGGGHGASSGFKIKFDDPKYKWFVDGLFGLEFKQK